MRNNALRDLARRAPDFQPKIIFDVGVNVGQSVAEFRSAYPLAAIYAFEPIPASYHELVTSMNGDDAVEAFNVGLSHRLENF